MKKVLDILKNEFERCLTLAGICLLLLVSFVYFPIKSVFIFNSAPLFPFSYLSIELN